MINKKKNVIKLLTVDAKTLDNSTHPPFHNVIDEDEKSLDSDSQKLIENLPASNTLIGKKEQLNKLRLLSSLEHDHDDNSTIGSSSLICGGLADFGVGEDSYDEVSSNLNVVGEDQYRKQNYFGQYAKISLNERYKWICRANQDVLPTEDLNLMKSTIFDTPLTKINDFPFAVRRPDIEDHQDEFDDYDQLDDQPHADLQHQQQQQLKQQHLSIDSHDNSFLSRNLTRPYTSTSTSRPLVPQLSSPSLRPSSPPLSPNKSFHNSLLQQTTSLAYSSDVNSKLSHYTINTPTSPRSKYLVGCLRESLNPRASLILRKHVNPDLHLQHHGMGDKMGLVFAESLSELPHVTSLNLCDNNLTDKSLSIIIHTICKMNNLISLNLSINKLDSQSCKALAEYLLLPFCSLKSLHLHKSDIDDFECHLFVAALNHNTVLEQLVLSSNLIGRSENLNAVKPNVITGGEALAALLKCNTCHLHSLDLSWNMLRMDGASSLADSLAINHHLLHLDLSYNSVGQHAGELIGKALLSNHTLKTLYLSNNAIPASACCTICVGIERNTTLESINLDGNPIGEEGAKMLMQLPFTCGQRVKISAQKCNLSIPNSNPDHISFDIGNIPGNYCLQMDHPYQRALCLKLLSLVAQNITLKFEQFNYEPPPNTTTTTTSRNTHNNNSTPTLIPIPLRQTRLTIPFEELSEHDKTLLANLQIIISTADDISKAKELFNKFDTDKSGALDIDELQVLVKHFSPAIEEAALEEAINGYDIDGRCVMELSEFLDFLSIQRSEALARVREICERPIICHVDRPKEIYIPPLSGTLYIRVSDGYIRKDLYKVFSAADQMNVLALAGCDEDNKVKLLSFSLANTRIRLREAWGIYQIILTDTRDRVTALEILLPYMYDPKEAKALLYKALNNDRTELTRLRDKMGFSLKPIVGMPDGYYSLDLSQEKDRNCFASLLEQSEYMKMLRIRDSYEGLGETGDVSQRGDWSSFRNCFYNNHRIYITPELFTAIPRYGRLTFDFSGSDLPPPQSVTISDVRLTNVLFNVALLNKIQKIQALNSLVMLTNETLRCIHGNGSNTPPVETRLKAKGIRQGIDKFYSKLLFREKQMKKSFKNEELRIGLKKGSMTSFAETDKKGSSDSDSDSDSSTSGSDEGDEESENSDNGEKGDEENEETARAPVRKVSVLQEALALTLGATTNTTPTTQMNTSRSTTKSESKISNSKKSSTSSASASTSSRIGFISESKSEYTSGASPSKSSSQLKRSNSTSRPSTSSAAGSGGASGGASGSGSGSETKTRRPFNPKQLLPQKSSFTVDENTGKVTRKLGNILTLTGSEKYLLEIGRKFINMSQIDKISNHAKCIRIIQALEDILGRVWILSKHLAIIIGCFQLGLTLKTQSFGTYRVELVISLFCRVVDLHNFDLVLGVLTPPEYACVICRLGYLNILNPLKPEGCYCLDFTIHEERVVGKILGTLSYQEPGVNFISPRFRWEWNFEDIPGWSLLPTWIDDAVFPHRGILAVQYYSGDGLNTNGCYPDTVFRRSLFAMVRIKEENYVKDEQAQEMGITNLVGEQCIKSHRNVWIQFLCPPKSSSAQIARGIPIGTVFARDLLSDNQITANNNATNTNTNNSNGSYNNLNLQQAAAPSSPSKKKTGPGNGPGNGNGKKK